MVCSIQKQTDLHYKDKFFNAKHSCCKKEKKVHGTLTLKP